MNAYVEIVLALGTSVGCLALILVIVANLSEGKVK